MYLSSYKERVGLAATLDQPNRSNEYNGFKFSYLVNQLVAVIDLFM
jgi:hypothetical protein